MRPPDEPIAHLLEQLMRIARVSALEELASGFAHELNQPLGAIATFSQAAERMLARPDPMIAAAREALGHISNEALSAGKGIHRIRRQFNNAVSARETCTMTEVLDELLPVLKLLGERSGTALQVTGATDLPAVTIDRLRVQHVLFTLVQNAFEMPRQNDRPALVRLALTGDKYGVRVEVVDNGNGIAPEHRDSVFRPFFTTKRDGTGLGLASSRAIIESHQGSIGFDNNDGQGTRFWFTLPASTGDSAS